MPGSNNYSMDPELIYEGSSNLTYRPSGSVVPGLATTTTSQPVAISKPSPFYQQKDFRTEKLAALKGMMSDRRANRVLNRYMKSEAGQQAETDFARAESQKYRASIDAYIQAGKDRRAAIGKPVVPQTTTAEPTLVSKSAGTAQTTQNTPRTTPRSTTSQTKRVSSIDWNQRARDHGFKDQADVAKWQATQPGLVVDGKFGDKSIARWRALQSGSTPEQKQPVAVIPEQSAQNAAVVVPGSTLHKTEIPMNDAPTVTSTAEQPRTTGTWAPTYWRSHHNGIKSIRIDGVDYPVMVSTGIAAYEGGLGIENDHSYALDPKTGKVRKLTEYATGNTNGTWADGSTWIDQSQLNTLAKLASSSGYQQAGVLRKQQMRRDAGLAFKQGGTMNRINYFQQGGIAPQQDVKARVTALVQAAMQGNKKAQQQVAQILEAAKAGNKEMMPLAQMITAVAEKLQGQATAAKWGAKLNYIQSLKFAKGGKTCPACEKKVEMKACGGKKAKKRYFGGII